MNNVYEASLDIMDAYLDSISDEEFLSSYLSLEDFQGPLAKDFMPLHSFFGNEYVVNSELFGNEHVFKNDERAKSKIVISYSVSGVVDFKFQSQVQRINSKSICSTSYGSSYTANDENYILVA